MDVSISYTATTREYIINFISRGIDVSISYTATTREYTSTIFQEVLMPVYHTRQQPESISSTLFK